MKLFAVMGLVAIAVYVGLLALDLNGWLALAGAFFAATWCERSAFLREKLGPLSTGEEPPDAKR